MVCNYWLAFKQQGVMSQFDNKAYMPINGKVLYQKLIA